MTDYKKIYPCLDMKDGKVVVGQQFLNVKEVEDPVNLAIYYDNSGADELILYDISASLENRQFFGELIESVRKVTTIPIMVGGGIATLEDIERTLAYGVGRVSINSGALKDPTLIARASEKFGKEAIVLSIDVRKVEGTYWAYASGGMEKTDIDAIDWAKKGEADGAGALVLNSIATDGEKNGFDLELLRDFSEAVSLPIVASGGAGKKEDFLTLWQEIPTISAGLAASIFHAKEVVINELKDYLKENGIPVAVAGGGGK